ncbi:MAG TPA: hypothetical protein VF221_11215, partial [Chloroflexota bacterium]
AEKLGLARDLLEDQARRVVVPGTGGSVLSIDAEVRLAQLTLDAGRQIRSLAPFGMEFGEPLFLARGVALEAISPLKGETHARVRLEQGGVRMSGVLFYAPPEFIQLRPGVRLDVVFHFQLDEWRGQIRPQLSLRDWRPAA